MTERIRKIVYQMHESVKLYKTLRVCGVSAFTAFIEVCVKAVSELLKKR